MKRPITGLVALLAGAFVAYSQGLGPGGWVSFVNYGGFTSYIYVRLGSTKLGGSDTGPPSTTANYASETANGNDWTVALYGAAGNNDLASSLLPLLTASGKPVTAPLANAVTDVVPGTWFSTAVGDVPGTVGNQAATVQVYAWYNDGGVYTSYAAAQAARVPTGFSATGNVITGGNVTGSPPYTPAVLPAFGTITLTPEPSTIALAVLGASAFLLGLGRKLKSDSAA